MAIPNLADAALTAYNSNAQKINEYRKWVNALQIELVEAARTIGTIYQPRINEQNLSSFDLFPAEFRCKGLSVFGPRELNRGFTITPFMHPNRGFTIKYTIVDDDGLPSLDTDRQPKIYDETVATEAQRHLLRYLELYAPEVLVKLIERARQQPTAQPQPAGA